MLVCLGTRYSSLISFVRQHWEEPGKFLGLPTGYPSIDFYSGFRPGELTLLAARPGVGKTSFALSVLRNLLPALKDGEGIAFFSLEMSIEEIFLRLVSIESRVPLSDIRSGTVPVEKRKVVEDAAGRIAHLGLYIDDDSSMSVSLIRSRLLQFRAEVVWRLIVIDYIGLLTPEGPIANRAVQLGDISRALKALAREIGAPVLALAQLNRSVEAEADKRPKLHHLRDSGCLEQDADNVWFLYRPSLVIDPSDRARWKKHYEHYTEVICRKARNGQQFRVALKWVGETASFEEYSTEEAREVAAQEGLGVVDW